ncbi:uncharacterized protein LOC128388267 isoform X1 [Panonychus citri]|uniref:uncharacterized protein LOC128388267 isoform X1 n=1 Tax=Panonychus citri TaxID=50023 RepID=UPI0023077548|nr:uncharacterized protein LOC128388267 isoform X1 [Panonychus citri]
MLMSESKLTRNSYNYENSDYNSNHHNLNSNQINYTNGYVNMSSVPFNCYSATSTNHRNNLIDPRNDLINYSSNLTISKRKCTRLLGFYVSQILLVIVSCIYLTVIVINLIQDIDNLLDSKDPLYKLSSLIVTTLVLSIFLLLHGNLCQRNYDLYLYFFDVALLTCFSYLNDTWGPDRKYLTQVQKYIGLVVTPAIGLLVFINRQMFDQFNIVGASPSIISMYKTYCYFQALIKWDLQNMIILANCAFAMSNTFTVNLIIFASLIIYATLVWIIAKIAVYKESKYLVFIHVVLSFIGLLWIPLQIIDVSCFREVNCQPQSLMISFAALGIGAPTMIVKLWVYIEQLKVYKNFGYGLTDSAFTTLANLESTSLLYGISNSVANCNNPIVIT